MTLDEIKAKPFGDLTVQERDFWFACEMVTYVDALNAWSQAKYAGGAA